MFAAKIEGLLPTSSTRFDFRAVGINLPTSAVEDDFVLAAITKPKVHGQTLLRSTLDTENEDAPIVTLVPAKCDLFHGPKSPGHPFEQLKTRL